MKKKIIAALLAASTVLSAAVFSSCGEKSEYPVTVGKITIEAEPENAVVLSKNLADIISTIGYDVKLAGRSDEVDRKGLTVVPSVGPASEASAKSILKLNADVVIADDTINPDTKKQLIKEGVPVIIPEKTSVPKEIKKVYSQLGEVLGGSITGKSEGAKAFDELFEELNDVKNAIAEKDIVKTVCYLYAEDGKIKTMNAGTWGAKILDFTGAENVFKNEESPIVTRRNLLLSNPDFIFCADKRVAYYLRDHKILKRLNALKKDIHVIKLDDINSQGGVAMDALEKMLRYMYPEEFD